MYSLRTLSLNGAESNIVLGSSYVLLKYEEYNAESSLFNNHVNTRLNKGGVHMTKQELKNYVDETGHYATVQGDGVEIDLFKNAGNAYYMLINGNTFDNLTKR